eukprot:1157363-Pelagomonas_calceolata.AAC.5
MEDLPGPASTSAAAAEEEGAEEGELDLEEGAVCDSDVQGEDSGSGEDEGRVGEEPLGAVGETDLTGNGASSDGSTEAGKADGRDAEGQGGSEGEECPGLQQQGQQAPPGGAKNRANVKLCPLWRSFRLTHLAAVEGA